MRLYAAVFAAAVCLAGQTRAAEQPNILWLTTEDIGPHLGCYGDKYALTPRLDAFARQGILYRNAWSNAPVCAPARTTIISGLYPPSTGSEHMRSETRLPAAFHMYPVEMRQAGYYCVNPGKEDYNLEKVGPVWDIPPKASAKPGQSNAERLEESAWEQLPKKQPFMAVFNHIGTHESKLRVRPHVWEHDPAKAPVPSYHPDVLDIRQDWAQYYDNITAMDAWFGAQLDRLETQGLGENTIVFFYGDHGAGMPRNKRNPHQSGLLVPLLIRAPKKFAHLIPGDQPIGGQTDRLVGFVDLAPTLLSLAGAPAPAHYQGRAFLGQFTQPAQKYLFGFRGRMDERMDLVRTVRNERYQYVRNYYPQLPAGQHNAYMFETPSTQAWKKLYDAGQLNPTQSQFWQRKAPEELYDLQADPDEVVNVVSSSQLQSVLQDLRAALDNWERAIRDVAFLPEDELHSRAPALSPYDLGHDDQKYPFERIYGMASRASNLKEEETPALIAGLGDPDSAVRYWAAEGLQARGPAAVAAGHDALRRAVETDPSWSVRVAAAQALGKSGTDADLSPALNCLVQAADGSTHGHYIASAALSALDALGPKARPIASQLAALPTEGPWTPARGADSVKRLLDHVLANLK